MHVWEWNHQMSVYVLFLVASLRRASVWRNCLFIAKFAVILVFVRFVERLFVLLHFFVVVGGSPWSYRVTFPFFLIFFFRCNFNKHCKESLKHLSFASLKTCGNPDAKQDASSALPWCGEGHSRMIKCASHRPASSSPLPWHFIPAFNSGLF